MNRGVPPTDVWLHEAIEARASKIAGRGLVAVAQIPAGVVVIRFGGRLVSTAELHGLFAEADRQGRYVDTITADHDIHLVLPEEVTRAFCQPQL